MADRKSPIYRCAGCGACCRQWIVEATPRDVLREPRIAKECKQLSEKTIFGRKLPLLEFVWSVAVGPAKPCPFQNVESQGCEIYATRPEECVSFAPDSFRCREGRRIEGLSPLRPVKGKSPTAADLIYAAIRG